MSKIRVLMMLSATAIGLVYLGLLSHLQTLTGTNRGDGIIGALLGLFISAWPAAGFLDMFFFERNALRRFALKWSSVWWLVFDLLVLGIRWYVLFIGLTLLYRKDGVSGFFAWTLRL